MFKDIQKDIVDPKISGQVNMVHALDTEDHKMVFTKSELKGNIQFQLKRKYDIYAIEAPIGTTIVITSESGRKYKITKVIDSGELFCVPMIFMPYEGYIKIDVDRDVKMYQIFICTVLNLYNDVYLSKNIKIINGIIHQTQPLSDKSKDFLTRTSIENPLFSYRWE